MCVIVILLLCMYWNIIIINIINDNVYVMILCINDNDIIINVILLCMY